MFAPSIAIALCVLTTAETAWYAPSSFPQYPSLTPDGAHLIYSDRGDLWTTPRTGGPATQLTSHPALELRSAISPDGSMLAFSSDRDGVTNLYVMPMRSEGDRLSSDGPIRRVTTSDRAQILSGFTPDGQALLFHAYGDPTIYRMPMMYRAPLDGGPVTALTTAHGREPRMSGTDGRVLFTRGSAPWERPAYRGSANREIWSYTQDTGAFERVTDARSNDGQAHMRPDGSIVLVSSRDGQNDVMLMSARGDLSSARNLTKLTPAPNTTIGHGVRDLTVSADGSTAAYGLWDRIQILDLTKYTPTQTDVRPTATGDVSTLDRRLITLDKKVSEVARHPSGEAVAVVARGEVLVRSTEDDHPTRRVTNDHARQRHIAWSPDGSRLWFTSDDDGHDAIWEATVALTRADLEPDEQEEADAPEPEENKGSDSEGGEVSQEKDQDPDTPEDPKTEPETEVTDAENTDKDAPADDKDAKEKDEDEKDVKNKTGEAWAGALTFDVKRVVEGPHTSRPMPSPDGRRMLYQRDRGDLVLRDLATGDDQLLLESWDEPEIRWASDSQHIVYSVADLDFNTDVWLMDVERPDEAINLTRHPDIDRAPRLSDDGSRLVFLSDRSRIGDNWEWDVWTIPLDKSLTKMTEYDLTERIDEAKKKAGKKKILPLVDFSEEQEKDAESHASLVFDNLDTAWTRARRVTSHEGAESDLELTAGGDRIIYSGEIDGSSGLWSVDHQGEDRKKITSGSVSNVHADTTGKRLSYVASGRAKHGSTTGGKEETWAIDADARIEVAAEQRQKFDETARTFGQSFYHPTMKDLDWDQLSDQYRDLATATRTSQAFNRVVDHLFGEVNGSHTGIYGGFAHDGPRQSIGYLGVETTVDPEGHRITRVIDEGPADVEHGLAVGEVVTHINGNDVRAVDLRSAMEGTSAQETLVTVLTEDGDKRQILTTPISWGGWSSIMRADEIQRRRDHVSQTSNDQLGYLHIRGMNMPSVHQFEQDLYAAAHGKDGLIIDVRDNGGGFTTDILLASLTAPTHAYTIPRGADIADVRPDSYPRDRRLIYAYSRPIVVLCNENSFSNAEIFSHAIQNTDRGTLIGEETFGGVISTGAFSLIDGARVRQPFRGWYLQDGTDMESRGAIPDIRVERTPADEAANVDRQLDQAIRVLLDSTSERPPDVHPRPAS
ncbi:MAG: S41 family peptidase [Phycisphaerales bacterium]|nr:S41 family peptidase [Phycisphaerales bacterium]